MASFKGGFSWGISASSYHIEGGNTDSDWHDFEREIFPDEADHWCGEACDHWNRWEEDYSLIEALGVTSYKYTLEWSRIEPKQGSYDRSAIEQYKTMFGELKRRNVTTIVCLHHFSSPRWYRNLGGFEKKENLAHFERFSKDMLEEFNGLIDVIVPINEIFVYAFMGYIFGRWEPRMRNLGMALKVTRNMIRAHFMVAEYIAKRSFGYKLSTAEHYRNLVPHDKGFVKRRISKFFMWVHTLAVTHCLVQNKYVFPLGFGGRVTRKPYREVDFVGIQYYGRIYIKILFSLFQGLNADFVFSPNGWRTDYIVGEVYPDDLKKSFEDFKSLGKPFLITEIGISTTDDEQRVKFLDKHIEVLENARKDGHDVRSFMYFTLMDCFEWAEGSSQHFGIVAVDRTSLKRTKKPSFDWYRNKIASTR